MKVAIFCGSSQGNNPLYAQEAASVGHYLATTQHEIIYGGGKVGLMGEVANAALSAGGRVTGVMPEALVNSEIAHPGLSEMYVVSNMHERKARMSELADVFIALPGGAGTLEEIVEQWTWGQLGLHNKPCALLNINDFYTPLESMKSKMVSDGFMSAAHGNMLFFSSSIADIISWATYYEPPVKKWAKNNA